MILPSTFAAEIKEGSVVVLPMDGEVTEAQFYFLRRIVKEAEAAKAAAVIIDMDTYGGSLQAAVNMLGTLMKTKVPTYTYVDSNAGSAGAMIALSTQHIYMAPVSAIGAAAPVQGGGQDLQATMNDKVVSYFSGYFRSAAEKNGYNPEVAEAFINKEKEVKIGDKVINPKGSLLTLSAQEATRVYDGKPLLASGIAPSIEELCKMAKLPEGNIVRAEASGFESLAQFITSLAPILLLGGILGAYLEFKTPGFGIFGVLSAICFLLFFTGHYIAGLTGFEVVAVFLLGVILVLVELIFFPGIVLPAALGTALIIGSLLFAMVDVFPSEPLAIDMGGLVGPMVNLGIALVLSIFAIAIIARFLPSLPLFNRLVLAGNVTAGPSFEASAPSLGVSVGDQGETRTILRPAGKAVFGSKLVDVVTDGEFIDPGTAIRVRLIEGERVVVELVG